jgi:hypothetical protein
MSRDVHSCSHLFGIIYEGRYWSAKIDDISFLIFFIFVELWLLLANSESAPRFFGDFFKVNILVMSDGIYIKSVREQNALKFQGAF